MASTTAISFTLPRLTNFSNHPSPKSFPLSFPLTLKRSRAFVTGKVNDDSPLHGNNDFIGDHSTLVSYNMLPRILKPLTSIMLFKSPNGDQTKRVEERRLELVNKYLSFNKGLVFQYRDLARVLQEWFFNVKEQEERSDAVEVGMWRLFRVGALVEKIVAWFLLGDHFINLAPLIFEFENLVLLIAGGMVLSFVTIMLPCFLIWMLLFSNPPPPPPSLPSFIPNMVDKLFPFIDLPMDPSNVVKDLMKLVNPNMVKDWIEIGQNVVKDLLALDMVRLVMLATHIKVLIPIMMMVAGVK